MILGIILIIIFIFLTIKLYKSNYKLEYDSWTFFEGSLGSGKTTVLTRLAISTRRKRIIYNFFVPLIKVCLWLIPFYNILRLFQKKENRLQIKCRGTDIYSNYPIRINKKLWSYAINKDVLNWIFRVNEDCIVVLDEVGYLFPNEMQKTDPLYVFCMTWFRHGTNAQVFCASQSLSETNVSFRRKVNRVYHLSNIKHCIIPLFSKVQIRQAIISEDMSNQYTDDLESRETNWYRFKYPSFHFRSRYGKDYYKLDSSDLIPISKYYQMTFDKLKMTNGKRWTDYYFRFE